MEKYILQNTSNQFLFTIFTRAICAMCETRVIFTRAIYVANMRYFRDMRYFCAILCKMIKVAQENSQIAVRIHLRITSESVFRHLELLAKIFGVSRFEQLHIIVKPLALFIRKMPLF